MKIKVVNNRKNTWYEHLKDNILEATKHNDFNPFTLQQEKNKYYYTVKISEECRAEILQEDCEEI